MAKLSTWITLCVLLALISVSIASPETPRKEIRLHRRQPEGDDDSPPTAGGGGDDKSKDHGDHDHPSDSKDDPKAKPGSGSGKGGSGGGKPNSATMMISHHGASGLITVAAVAGAFFV